jgi:hypothetical protein
VAPGRAIVCDLYDPAAGGNRLIVLIELADGATAATVTAEARKAVFTACGIFPGAVRVVPRGFLVKSSSGKLSRSASYRKFREQPPE